MTPDYPFIQSWTPERRQRVITRINPECRQQYVWHGSFESGSGMYGTVIGGGFNCPDGHPYVVLLDDAPEAVIWLSADEMEPTS